LPRRGSAKPRGRYDAPWFTAWLVNLLDALRIDRAVLVGNSMGGRISLEVGMRAPDRCTGLVLVHNDDKQAGKVPTGTEQEEATPLALRIFYCLAKLGIRVLGVAPRIGKHALHAEIVGIGRAFRACEIVGLRLIKI